MLYIHQALLEKQTKDYFCPWDVGHLGPPVDVQVGAPALPGFLSQ